MENMGGLRKLYYIDADDFDHLIPADDDLFELGLKGGSTIEEIEFTPETGKVSESEEESDNGTIYNYEASCSIPKCGPGNINPLDDLKHKRIMIVAEDNNENFWLTGAPGSYFNILSSGSTGQVTSDLNARQLKISGALSNGSIFISTPFPT
jgi:hypothetical protein